MTRINTNVSSLLAQRIVGQNNASLNTSLERLSTGYRINSGGDDPAGLIASEALRSEKTSISSAIANAERADQVLNIAEGGLQEISSLLLEVQSLVGQSASSAGTSQDEREANQQQIDSIIQTIDRIAESTSFQGTKLLNGSLDFSVGSQATAVDDLQVNAAKLATGETRDVQVLVTQSAQRGSLFLSLGGTSLDLTDASSSFTFEIAGEDGAREFSFASGTTTANIATTLNSFKSVTGVSAAVSGNGIVLQATEFGSNSFVAVDVIDDGGQAGGVAQVNSNDTGTAIAPGFTALAAVNNPVRDEGQDLGATINGVSANADGLKASISNEFLDVEIQLASGSAQTLASINAFTVTGGGASFNLGPEVNISNQVRIGIGNVAARNIGSAGTGFLSSLGSGGANNVVDGDKEQAQEIVNESITEIAKLRGRLGAVQKNTIGATIRSLGVALENTSAAESAIRDTDFAQATAELTRSQVLVAASQNVLSIANSQSQNVLSLL